MAVLLGATALLSAVFLPAVDFGSRVVLGFFGAAMVVGGMGFSKG